MSIPELFQEVSGSGATDFAAVVQYCAEAGPSCLIDGLALNSYVEPVYTMDADFVLAHGLLSDVMPKLAKHGFQLQEYAHSWNATMPGSQLRIQFTRDPRYAEFPARAQTGELFGMLVRIGALEDLLQGKIWAWKDPQRGLSKREKDRLDLVRIGETFPHLRPRLPAEIQQLFSKGSS